jgi:digeranylgeranylglycerophospholipid reductase
MRRLDYDVLVIGAGPAGSTAATFAARGGARTLLVEKRAEIGTPVRCGEGVAKGWLDEIGLPAHGAFVANEVRGARVVAPDGAVLEVDERFAGNETGYVLERELFDRELAKRAAKAGADIMIRTTATALHKENGTVIGARVEHMGEVLDIRTRVVVGADGFESQVGRWAGLPTHLRAGDIEACLQYTMVGVEVDADFNEFYVGSVAPGGYVWVFPKADDVANVGLGVNLARVRDRAEARRYLEAFVRRHPRFRRGRVLEEVAGGVSVSLPLDRTVAPGLLLVGDAARLIDPLTGGGILNGCLSGKFAGEVAAASVAAGDASASALQAYERRWRQRLEEGLVRNYLIKERVHRMDDATLSQLVRAVAEVQPERLTALDILRKVKERYPELARRFGGIV